MYTTVSIHGVTRGVNFTRNILLRTLGLNTESMKKMTFLAYLIIQMTSECIHVVYRLLPKPGFVGLSVVEKQEHTFYVIQG